MIPVLILAAHSFLHSGSISNDAVPPFLVGQQVQIEATDCVGNTIDIYEDPKLLITMPNPFIPDKEGSYVYYTDHKESTETIELKDGWVLQKSTCPGRRK